jgi:predicted solute-binding protein
MVDSEVSTARARGNDSLSRPMIEDYLRHSLHYELGPGDLAGLELFYRFAEEDGLIPPR